MTLQEMQEVSRRKSGRAFAQRSAQRSSNEQLHVALLDAVEQFVASMKSVAADRTLIAAGGDLAQRLADMQGRAELSRKYGFPK